MPVVRNTAIKVAWAIAPKPKHVLMSSLVVALGALAAGKLWRSLLSYVSNRKCAKYGREAADACREQREKVSEEEWTEEDEALLKLGVCELLEKLRSGEIKSVQAVRVYLRKALDSSAQRNINCVTQPVLGALEHAASCDSLLESGQGAGLLQGLPISIKENMDIAGMVSHWGVSSQCGHDAAEDSIIVKVLKSHGAVPFVKTNVPQTMFSFECSNPVYGATLNPHDPTRGPGGSSGGEAALMAMGGSLLGVGTDIAGSTRIPAAFCGVTGFKPTMGRISNKGTGTPVRGITGVGKTAGPQAQTVAGCRLLMQALCSELMWRLDPTLCPVPFKANRCTQQRTLRIGYYDYDGFFPVTPAYKRAVAEAKDALAARGHELVSFTPPDVKRAMELYYSIVGADGGSTLRDALRYDIKDPAIKHIVQLASMPRLILGFARPVAGVLWPRSGHTLCQSKSRRVSELWTLLDKRRAYINEFISAWQRLGLDGVICPPHVMGAPPLATCGEMTCSFSYTMLFNLLDFPAGVVPVTKVTTQDELALRSHPQNNYWDKRIHDLSVGSSGLPVAVQCVTLPWQDETCLYLMQELETGTKSTATTSSSSQ